MKSSNATPPPSDQTQTSTIQQPAPPSTSSSNEVNTAPVTPSLQATSISQPQTSIQPPCSVSTPPTVVSQLAQGPRPVATNQIRPHGEYLVLLAPNPRQPGAVQGIRYNMALQPNILQANPALLRSINASQIIRTQTSNSGVMQTQTSQAQTTTLANIQGRHVQIPFSTAGPRGQITLANGQTMIPSIPMQRHPMMTSRATILQPPTLLRGVQPGMGVPVIPTSQPIGINVPGTMPQAPMIHQVNLMNSSATAPSQMTTDEALRKGVSFFERLLTKVNIKSKKTTLQNLIQALIDGKKTSEQFASALQKEMDSGVQPQLVPFLDLLLPHLIKSINAGETKLPGIRPPSMRDSSPLVDEQSPSTSSPSKVQSNNTTAKKKKTPLAPGQKSAYAIKKEAREAKKKEREILAAAQSIKIEKPDDKKEAEKVEKPVKPKAEKPKRQDKQKRQEKQLESLSSALRDDDDVNDVAAMGGVNLAEESQKIMASGAELVGTQIRSCKDEPFLDTKALSSRIARIAKEHNLSEPSKDVVTIISHATQERLKDMVERLGILAEHRSENLKLNPKYEVSTDIKGQIKFLAELDRIEKRRYEEQERELLLKVAKSRSKVEDPEQQKLRQKAKDMQRAEQEEVRQREANETALLAIGPRKKLKSTPASSVSSFSQSSHLSNSKTSLDLRGDSIRRVKRVNMRDLQVLLELDRTHLNRLVKITAQ